jgi:hypothetical protein
VLDAYGDAVVGKGTGEVAMDVNWEKSTTDLGKGGWEIATKRREEVGGEKILVRESTALIPLCQDPNWI